MAPQLFEEIDDTLSANIIEETSTVVEETNTNL